LKAPDEEIQYTCSLPTPYPFLIVIGIFPIPLLPPFFENFVRIAPEGRTVL